MNKTYKKQGQARQLHIYNQEGEEVFNLYRRCTAGRKKKQKQVTGTFSIVKITYYEAFSDGERKHLNSEEKTGPAQVKT